MTKKTPSTVDRFRALGVFNTHEFALRFGTKGVDDYVVTYRPYESRTLSGNETSVWAPGRKLNPAGHWQNYAGGKIFHGPRAVSRPLAVAWATTEFKITDWAPCPVDPSALVPKTVRDRGLAWLKKQDPARDQPPAGGRR